MSVTAGFEQTFGVKPLVHASAPGRVNLIGEHTDYNGGAVLPAALPQRVHIALAHQAPAKITIKSSRFADKIERPIGDLKRGDWTDYAMGAVMKAAELGWLEGGLLLQIESDVPDGAGVSSSAALITAILRAAAQLGRATTNAVAIAQHARAVENDYIGMPCGIMDQMAVGLADHGRALALDTQSLEYEVIDIPQGWRFVVIHSGVRRELADGRYKTRFEECQAASKQLNAEMLCHLDASQIAAMSALPENLVRRTRHVTSEHKRTLEATSALKADDLDRFARLMNESHHSYAQDFEASTLAIDALVEDALATGAKGARLTGGGFGGCIVALYQAADADDAVARLIENYPDAWRV